MPACAGMTRIEVKKLCFLLAVLVSWGLSAPAHAFTAPEMEAYCQDGNHNFRITKGLQPDQRPAAQEVIQLAGRLTNMALVRAPLLRVLRNTALRLINRIPAVKRGITLKLSGLSRADMARLPARSQQEARKQPAGSDFKLVA